jgi:transglutaminase-like putative cysteine protease
MTSKRIRLTRAELYKKVWPTPMRTLAKEFGMSDVGLAKICRKHNIPVPPVGYWRRKETGYKVNRPRLPASKEGSSQLDRSQYQRASCVIARYVKGELTDQELVDAFLAR